MSTPSPQRSKGELTLNHLIGASSGLLIVIFTSWVNMQIKVSAIIQSGADMKESIQEIKADLRQSTSDNKVILQELGKIEQRLDDKDKPAEQK